jgi:hypothetical protein
MRGPSTVPRRSTSPGSPFSIDVVILVPRGKRLGVLCHRDATARATLPWDLIGRDETLVAGARRVAQTAVGAEPAWLEQLGAFADRTAHPSGARLSVGYVSVLPATGVGEAAGTSWNDVRQAGALVERHRQMLSAGLDAVRTRMDHAPVAFRLLPPSFTLTELQEIYELLLGRRLHKASFRRALQAARLVQATSEWRSEGRGRPARLFRYAARRRRARRRGVRFDMLQAGGNPGEG